MIIAWREEIKPIKTIEKKLKFYKAFRDNKKQIYNIRQYQLANQKRLDELAEEYETEKGRRDTKAERVAELEKMTATIRILIKIDRAEREDIEEQLMSFELSDEKRQELVNKRDEINKSIDEKIHELQDKEEMKAIISKYEVKDIGAMEDEMSSLKVMISKCNVIWSSLLKGKNWDEIDRILTTNDFTAEKGTIYKTTKAFRNRG